MLRLATEQDYPTLKEMFDKIIEVNPFTKSMFENHEDVENLILSYTRNIQNKGCFLLMKEEEPIGLVAMETQPVPGADLLYARLSAIYLKPECRGVKENIDSLYAAFETWGKTVGCSYYILSISKEGVDPSKRGYMKYEVIHIKAVS